MILGLLFAGITGAAIHGDTVYTWGDRLLAWTLPKLTSRSLATLEKPASAGCLDQNGTGLFLQEGDRLVYRKAPDWKPREMDHGIDMHDCMAVTLLGHRGVLVVHRGMQLRFLRIPGFSLQGNLLVLQPIAARRVAGNRRRWRWLSGHPLRQLLDQEPDRF